VNEALVEQYLNGFPRSRHGRQPRVAQGLPHLIRLLRQQGIVPISDSRPVPTAIDQWLHQYEQYLDHVLGAAANTRKNYLFIARRLLTACFGTACTWPDETLLVNAKWLVTPALHTTFETQTD
jgi:hypothetical protein